MRASYDPVLKFPEGVRHASRAIRTRYVLGQICYFLDWLVPRGIWAAFLRTGTAAARCPSHVCVQSSSFIFCHMSKKQTVNCPDAVLPEVSPKGLKNARNG